MARSLSLHLMVKVPWMVRFSHSYTASNQFSGGWGGWGGVLSAKQTAKEQLTFKKSLQHERRPKQTKRRNLEKRNVMQEMVKSK